MQVKTQPFKEALEIKSDGICFDVYGNGSKRLGDLSVTKAGLVWSKVAGGKPMRNQGINVRWEEFINWVQTRKEAAKNGGVMKLSAPKGKPAKMAGKTANKGAAEKMDARGAGGAKLASKGASALKIASKTIPSLKIASKTASAMKLASKTGAATKLPSKMLSSVRPVSGAARLAPQNGTPVKLPATRLPQSKAKTKTATAAKKPGTAAKASTAAGRKAN